MQFPALIEGLPLLLTVFALGIRHGLDADHLAAIDGLTRFNTAMQARWARACGALFSVGHGLVVVVAAVLIGATATHVTVPIWTRDLGMWISIVSLTALGLLNLLLLMRTPLEQTVATKGWRSNVLARFVRTSDPLGVIALGACYALSFDTLSYAVVFAGGHVASGDWQRPFGLALAFTVGMLLVDGLNGRWVASILERADRRAMRLSRAIGWFVAALSLAIAVLSATEYFKPSSDGLLEPVGFFVGTAVAATAACLAYGLSRERLLT